MTTKIGAFGCLRAMTDDDLEMVLTWRNTPEIRKNMYSQGVILLSEHRTWWEGVRDNSYIKNMIYEKDGQARGVVNFSSIEAQHATADWGFYTSPTAPVGSGSQMGFCALEFAFSNMQIHKLCAEVLAFNTISLTYHQNLGFYQEGILKGQKIICGAYVDVYRLAIFSHQWRHKRTEIIEKLSRRL